MLAGNAARLKQRGMAEKTMARALLNVEGRKYQAGPESKLTEQQKGELMACFHS